ncbi:MAG: tRNA-(ms[2]io[6]A)-hydroxylase [Planctomycetes bacterium]|nr:tRNA-(ms[2]io[6]A)-hydroxylase [Planctomycetota bacterium]
MSVDASTLSRPFVTPPSWARALLPHVDELLLEQAHLEKKAAAGAVQFLFRVPLDAGLHRQLSALAREELVHFERTLKLLAARGVAFEAQTSSGYAERLKKAVRRDHTGRLTDELLVAAIIEHRSHERMLLLADALAEVEPEVARFYADLCPAEERHEQLYFDLATLVVDADTARSRHRELLAHEARVLAELAFCARLHGGLPAHDDGPDQQA